MQGRDIAMIRGSVLAIVVMAVTVVWTQTFVDGEIARFESATSTGQANPNS